MYVGDDLKKLEDSYNHAQTQWIDNMINACQVSLLYTYHRTSVGKIDRGILLKFWGGGGEVIKISNQFESSGAFYPLPPP